MAGYLSEPGDPPVEADGYCTVCAGACDYDESICGQCLRAERALDVEDEPAGAGGDR